MPKAIINLKNDYGFLIDMDVTDPANPSVDVYDFEGNQISGGGGGGEGPVIDTVTIINNSGSELSLDTLGLLIVVDGYATLEESALADGETKEIKVISNNENVGYGMGYYGDLTYTTSNLVNCAVNEIGYLYPTDPTAAASATITVTA